MEARWPATPGESRPSGTLTCQALRGLPAWPGEEMAAYLAQVTDRTTVSRLLGMSWLAVGRICRTGGGAAPGLGPVREAASDRR